MPKRPAPPDGWMWKDEADALLRIGHTELRRIEDEAYRRIAQRIAAGETADVVLREERDRALARMDALDMGMHAAFASDLQHH